MTTIESTRPSSAGDGSALAALRSRLGCSVLTAEDESYEIARKVQNLRYDARPLAIVRVAGERDVAEAVRFASQNGYSLAVRGGGHSIVGFGSVDGGIMVDLSEFKRVLIDPATRVARVQGGATSGDLAGPAHSAGLALSTGDTATVGLGGLATGGGIGFMVRKYGLAIDNLLSARVVLADGSIVNASSIENPDLFWAIRGGGGNFGIVTEFEFRLAPVKMIYGGALVLPASREVLRGVLDYATAAPDDLSVIVNLMHAPPAPFIPEDRLGQPSIMVLACWTGDLDAGERVMAPLRALATPIADAVGPMPYPAIYNFTAPQEQPHLAVVRATYTDHVSDEVIDRSIEALDAATSPMSLIQFRPLGGAAARVPQSETAYAHRDAAHFFSVIALWLDPSEDYDAHHAWAEALWSDVRQHGRGAYVNFLQDEGETRLRDAYPGDTHERLVATKRKYDPANLFALNQNIKP